MLQYCDPHGKLSIDQQDKILRFADIVKAELDRSGQRVALVSFSGLDLALLGIRYSHAGISLKASENAAWSVRQLYYDCAQSKPRIFDQGMSGFVMGGANPDLSYVSIVLLPPQQAVPLEHAALDKQQALALLGPTYSANAYPFSTLYQNCNQWVMELMASAWGGLGHEANVRASAQQWLKERAYEPSVVDVGHRPFMWIASTLPWLRSDDHPTQDLQRNTYRVSMPAAIEDFVQAAAPGATRVELCHTDKYVVIRRGWKMIADGCKAQDGDETISLLD